VGGVVVVAPEGAACFAPVVEAELLAKAVPGAAAAASAHATAMSVLVFTDVKSSQRLGLLRQLSFRLHETRDQRAPADQDQAVAECRLADLFWV
jgi:hypothetical protein